MAAVKDLLVKYLYLVAITESPPDISHTFDLQLDQIILYLFQQNKMPYLGPLEDFPISPTRLNEELFGIGSWTKARISRVGRHHSWSADSTISNATSDISRSPSLSISLDSDDQQSNLHPVSLGQASRRKRSLDTGQSVRPHVALRTLCRYRSRATSCTDSPILIVRNDLSKASSERSHKRRKRCDGEEQGGLRLRFGTSSARSELSQASDASIRWAGEERTHGRPALMLELWQQQTFKQEPWHLEALARELGSRTEE